VEFRTLILLVLPLSLAAQDCTQRLAEDFVPMTTTERLASAAASVASPRVFLAVGIRAALNQSMDRQREWGQGMEGYGLRYGSAWAENFIGQFAEQGAAWKLHEDNRYFVSGEHGFARRLAYAAASTVLARHDDGSRGISFSAVGGTAAGAFVARTWQPRSTTSAGDAAVSFGLTMGVRAGLNIFREFAPRSVRFLFR
jgi:hypothetical protein